MSWVAIMIAFMPLAQTLFTVVQATSLGSPANLAAWRAGAWPRLACSTLPMITSCTCSGLIPAFSTAPLMAVAPSWVADTSARLPPKLPMGVRTADTMTTSLAMAAGVLVFSRCKGSLRRKIDGGS